MANDTLVPMTEVRTLSRPVPAHLLAARNEIQRSPELQAIFKRAKTEKMENNDFVLHLSNALDSRITGQFADIQETARYLVDEYKQLGDGLLIISRETGRAVYKVTDEDLWQPPMTVRDDGRRVIPPPRIRPDLEGYLIQWVFDEVRENRILREIQEKIPTTSLLLETGDPRLLPVTRAGRTKIADEIREQLPNLIPVWVRGAPADFLRYFDISTQDPDDPYLTSLVQSTAVASSRFNIQDSKTYNLQFDQRIALMGKISAQWVAEMARVLSLEAHCREGKSFPINEITRDLLEGGAWIFNPSEYEEIVRSLPSARAWLDMLPIEGARATKLCGARVGVIVLHPDEYELRSREVHDRWDIVATCSYTLWVDWRNVEALNLIDVPMRAHPV